MKGLDASGRQAVVLWFPDRSGGVAAHRLAHRRVRARAPGRAVPGSGRVWTARAWRASDARHRGAVVLLASDLAWPQLAQVLTERLYAPSAGPVRGSQRCVPRRRAGNAVRRQDVVGRAAAAGRPRPLGEPSWALGSRARGAFGRLVDVGAVGLAWLARHEPRVAAGHEAPERRSGGPAAVARDEDDDRLDDRRPLRLGHRRERGVAVRVALDPDDCPSRLSLS